jgi:hypothetical protein
VSFYVFHPLPCTAPAKKLKAGSSTGSLKFTIMPNKYLPATGSERVVWLNNFNNKLSYYAPLLTIPAEDVSQTGKDYKALFYAVNTTNQLKQTQKQATAYKAALMHSGGQPLGSVPVMPVSGPVPEAVPAGIFDRICRMVQRMKNHPAYTDSIGQDLNIISPADVTDLNSMLPVLRFKIDVGRPSLKWSKGSADATAIYADRNDGKGFVLVSRFVRGRYLDTSPLTPGKIADDWKYKAIFIVADEEVGQMSQVITVRVMNQ